MIHQIGDTVYFFRVHGIPGPQGSKNVGQFGQVYESSKKVAPWREAVKWAVLQDPDKVGLPLSGPVEVHVIFYLTRPGGHYGTGRNADVLKPSAPEYPAVKPDLDKIARATFDALKDAKVYRDDAQVVRQVLAQAYGGPGAAIHVYGTPLDEP